jgi:hypothetical protein
VGAAAGSGAGAAGAGSTAGPAEAGAEVGAGAAGATTTVGPAAPTAVGPEKAGGGSSPWVVIAFVLVVVAALWRQWQSGNLHGAQ